MLRQGVAAAAPRWVRAAGMTLALAVPLAVNPWAPDAYNGIKVLVVYGLTLAMIAGWAAGYAAARTPRWVVTGAELAGLVLLLAALLSTATSVDPVLTFFGAPGRYEGLFALASYVALYLCGVHFFGTPAGVRALARCAAVGGAVAAAYAVMQLSGSPLFPGEAEIRTWYAAGGVPRVFATLGSPIALGAYLCVTVPLSFGAAGSARPPARTLWLASGAAGLMALVLTQTRAAWAGVIVGIGVLLATLGREHRRQVIAAAAAGLLAAGILLSAASVTPAQIATRAAGVAEVGGGSFGQRVYIWERTVALVRARPITGWGLETLRVIFPYDRPSLVKMFGVRPVIIDKAHNDLLQAAVSMGIPGALASLAFWIAVAWAAIRLCRRRAGNDRLLACGWLGALAAYLVQVQFSFSLVAVAPLVWLGAGAAAGWEAREAVVAP